MNICNIKVFAGRFARQYENHKFVQFMPTKEHEFSAKAQWSFLAASNGKSLCDGTGVNVKQLDAAKSLTKPYSSQIWTSQ